MLNDFEYDSFINLSTLTGKYIISSLRMKKLSPRDTNTLNQRLQISSAKLKLLTG